MKEELSERERQCLYWAAKDKNIIETANQLSLSPETIKTYRKLALRKLNCQTIGGALLTAIHTGELQLEVYN